MLSYSFNQYHLRTWLAMAVHESGEEGVAEVSGFKSQRLNAGRTCQRGPLAWTRLSPRPRAFTDLASPLL